MARKGAGKSEVVDRTAIGKRAVVKVPVTTIGTRDDLVALIMETIAGKICNEGWYEGSLEGWQDSWRGGCIEGRDNGWDDSCDEGWIEGSDDGWVDG